MSNSRSSLFRQVMLFYRDRRGGRSLTAAAFIPQGELMVGPSLGQLKKSFPSSDKKNGADSPWRIKFKAIQGFNRYWQTNRICYAGSCVPIPYRFPEIMRLARAFLLRIAKKNNFPDLPLAA